MTGQLVAIAFPAFIASLVEFVEALTIVLAVGTTRGWRSALVGTAAGVLVLALLIAAFGPALTYAPLQTLQIVLGALLIFFGLRWLRKASLRYAGAIPMGDETHRFAHTTSQLGDGPTTGSLDGLGVFTAFNGVVVEGLEIVFIVIAVGASSKNLTLAELGAGAAGAIIVVLAIALRKPLAHVPANTLKFVVGLMLSSLGTLWLGEGMGIAWPGDDLSALWIGVAYLAAAAIGIGFGRRRENSRGGRVSA
jgi:Ca2+/H+ antiporter, TMEM165/GDT1 family